MKKIYLLLIFITVIFNMYLILEWNPYSTTNDIAVNSYENIDINTVSDMNNNEQHEYNKFEEISFYLSEEKGIESLSDKDRQELNNILCKLSTSDLGKWLDLENNKDNHSVIEFFRIIQKRMSYDDYQKVRSIIEKIIDVDKVETILKK